MRARQKILIATIGLIEQAGFQAVNIAAVATAAGVSRQTVYSNFGTLEQVISQSISDVVREALGEVQASVATAATAYEYVVELIVAGRLVLRTHPALATLVLAERGNPLFDDEMMAYAKPFGVELLQPMVERNLLGPKYIDDVVEIAVRLGLSAIMFDSDAVRRDDDLRQFLARWLQPAMTAIM
ncbi:TetR/AcrR family transcriptional regulator [Tomitella biformata]|uniref:TetR/AcrR family transcriptional regulator n=1 Tax=Tomitella biformata TaxID=630403 RepID=UPI00046728BA|nr:TetR/AcrR family transcriptional regulator [Tomitella biformata]